MVSLSHRAGIGLIACIMLPSCALNTIRLDRATAMGTAGKAATDGTSKVITDVQAANRDVLIKLKAMDEHCDLLKPVIPLGRPRAGETLCSTIAPRKGDFSIKRWSRVEFAPSLAVISGITAYLGAVDAITTRKPVDLAAEVADAEAKLRTVADSAAAIAGAPGLPSLTADQTAAISGTLTLLGGILDEEGRVADLRSFEKDNDQREFSASLDALRRVNRASIAALDGQLLSQRALLSAQLGKMQHADFEARQAVVANLMATIEQDEALPELHAALDKAVDAFASAHVLYRTLLFDSHAPLSRAERQKRAQVAQARVLAALSNLTAIIKAF